MKPALILTVSGTILLGSASMVNAQETQQSAPPSARAKMVEDANMSAQSGTDVSYGGVSDTRSETGGAQTEGAHPPVAPITPISSPSSACAGGARCDLFSKH
ncbi:hypothetical protein AWB69_08110 [Caballeronia udeis]|uniref:Lipoprotein n=1 Tax=Caballeronia udeis TaxID=1232866 RepID=A0A158JJ22_9BURK|nr:hypothetical protein AWB69_08110 [Caballeronia udeis]